MGKTVELNRCEMLAEYGTLLNDEEEMIFIINGYFPGKPENSVVYYNGGEDALLERSSGQLLVMDRINEHVRGSLEKASYVLIQENDSEQLYKAEVSSEDVSEFLKKMREERDYPTPTLHPYPLTTGAYEPGEKICDSCHKSTKIYYREEAEDGSQVTVCPKCVWKVPKYKTNRPKAYFWPCHCNGEETIYYGKLRYEDITKNMWMEYLKHWNYEGNPYPRGDASRLKEGIKNGSVEAHLFKCSKCQAHLVYCIEED